MGRQRVQKPLNLVGRPVVRYIHGGRIHQGQLCQKLAYVRTLEDGIPQSWEHVHYTRPEVDQAEAVITWHGELIRSYAVQAASEKITRLANETITMLREKTGEGTEGRRQHSRPGCHRPDGEGRTQDGRNEAGTGHRPAGHPPAFDTGRPEGPLHDDGPSRLMVDANFANSANFPRSIPQKLAELAKLAPTDKVNCQSAPGWPAVSITRKNGEHPRRDSTRFQGVKKWISPRFGFLTQTRPWTYPEQK